jgi:hypothetical protein
MYYLSGLLKLLVATCNYYSFLHVITYKLILLNKLFSNLIPSVRGFKNICRSG